MDLMIYENSMFGKLRFVFIDEDPWFVAKDVCTCLGLSNSRDSVSSLDKDEKCSQLLYTAGGLQKLTVVSEAGLYSLILRSRQPKAKEFKRWVLHDVLPTIRKTGYYSGVEYKRAVTRKGSEERVCLHRNALAMAAAAHAVSGDIPGKYRV